LLRVPNFHCVVFHPTRLGEILREFLLRSGHGLAFSVEQHRPRAGGALIKCKDVSHGHKINRNKRSKKETIRA
jgi:hypothetical protein